MTAPLRASTSAAPADAANRLHLRRLGLAEYEGVWRAMRAYTDERDERAMDQLWLVEHRPVFTQGQAGKAEHILAPGDIPVVQVDRGGQVTYHGPGQLVAYPLIDLERRGIGVRDFVARLEQAVIDLLDGYGVAGERVAGAPGIYVGGAKIASLGLRVRRGRSFHGLALNVDMDLEPFQRINPCGYSGLQVTQLTAHAPVRPDEVADRLVSCLAGRLEYTEIVGDEPPELTP